MAGALVKVPPTARRGEVIEIKALAAHTMETGYRRTERGEPIPRNILRSFTCTYNGVEVFSAELHPAISANPYFAFTTIATESGTLAFHWAGDDGFSLSTSAAIVVT